MNKQIVDSAMNALKELSTDITAAQKDHFASLITLLTACYGKKPAAKAVLILNDERSTTTYCVNADVFEAAGMVSAVFDTLNVRTVAQMPAQEDLH